MYVRYYNLTSERSQRARYLFNQNPTHSGYTKEHTYANLYAFPATSRNLSAEAGIRGKTPYRAMNHPVTGVVTKADLASMEHISLVKCWLREAGAHNVLVTSAVNNNGVTELLPCSIQKKAIANFDRFSDENDDGDTQIRINEQ